MAAGNEVVLIPRRRVSELTGLQRSALYERVSRGTFPRPVRIGSAAVRWVEGEVREWIQAQVDASRCATPAPAIAEAIGRVRRVRRSPKRTAETA
jgi:prophage regulatory protein